MTARARIRWPKVKPCPSCGHMPNREGGLVDSDGAHIGPFFVACIVRLAPTYDQTCNQFAHGDTREGAAKAWNDLPVQPPLIGAGLVHERDVEERFRQ